MSARRLVVAVVIVAVLAPAAWAVRWWWRATHPEIPDDTPSGWVPAVVTSAGVRLEFGEPFGVAVAADGAIYVADASEAPAIYRVGAAGDVRRLAGGRRGFADGAGEQAAFDTPSHIALDPAGVLYVADTGNHAIRRVTPDGRVTTIAGDGTPGGGEGTAARLNGPVGIAVAHDGRVVVADTYNDRVVVLTPPAQTMGPASGTAREARWAATTLAGSGMPGLVDGPADTAAFDTPADVAAPGDGSVIVADTGNDALRRVAPDGTVTTLMAVDFTGAASVLWRPLGVAAASMGRIYVTDSRARIVEVVPGGGRRVLAGDAPGHAPGLGTAARFREPAGIAVTPDGRVVVADSGNALVRVLDLPARLGDWPPLMLRHRPGFDAAAFARVPLVWPVEPQDGPHEVAGTLGEPRGNPGGDGRERFHAGVDVRADHGTPVRAVRSGTVSAVLPAGSTGTLSEYVSIGPITYVHLRVGRDRADRPAADWAAILADPVSGRPARVRVRRGTRIQAGDLVGTVNRFQHVHLNVGPPGEEHNPLLVGLPGLRDSVAPVISSVTITSPEGVPLTDREAARLIVRGPVHVVVEAFDRMDDSPPRRRLGLFKVGYRVLHADGAPASQRPDPWIAITFDRLPASADAPLVLYAPGSGIPFYGSRVTRYRYVATSRVDGDRIVEAPWEPAAAGDYIIRALAADVEGNTTSRDVAVRVPSEE